MTLWALDGKPAAEPFKGHEGWVSSVAFSPDGTRLASGGKDGTARLWTLDGMALGRYRAVGFQILSVATDSRDRVVAGDTGGHITILQVAASHVVPPIWSHAALAAAAAGLLFWLLTASRAVRRLRLGATPGTELPPVAYFLESDSPIDDPAHAGEAMRLLTERLSRFMRNRNTAAPMAFALTGDWGTGKSSVMSLVQRDLRQHNYPSIWFNAWHHQNEAHLFAALMEAIRQRAAAPLFSLRNLAFRLRLVSLRFNAAPVANTLRLFVVVLALTIVVRVLMQQGVWDATSKLSESLQGAVNTAVFGLAATGLLWTITGNLFKPFGVNPANLVGTSAGWFRIARFAERLDFRQRFGRAFNDVCEAFGDRRLVLIIDDLDRCRAEFVPEVLEAVNFLTSSGRCFVLLGISVKPVHAAVGLAFQNIAEELAKQDGLPNGHKARREFANAYLEKLINLQVEVPRFDSKTLQDWLAHAVDQIELVSSRRYGFGRLLLGAVAALGVGILAALALGPLGQPSATIQADGGGAATLAAGPSDEVSPAPVAGPVGAVGAGSETTATPPPTGTETPAPRPFEKGDEVLPRERVAVVDRSDAMLFWKWWPALALACVLAFAVAFADPRFRRVFRPLDEPDVLEDSAAFQEAFAAWAPLVLARHDSPRAVKRFANRMRYLVAGLTGEALKASALPLMTIGALHEVGEIDHGVPHANWKRRTKWPTAASDDLKRMGSAADVATLASQVEPEHWKLYWSLASSVRFAGSGPDEEQDGEA